MTHLEPQISVEGTDNPEIVKFVLDRRISSERSRTYFDAESASHDPLASRLFATYGVQALLFVENSIMVTKTEGVEWSDLVGRLEEVIRTELGRRTAGRRHSGRKSSTGWRGSRVTRATEEEPSGPQSLLGSPVDAGGAGRFRFRVSPDVRMMVSWLLGAASVAQLFWIIPASGLDRIGTLVVRLGTTIGLLLLWLVFTEVKER